MLRHRKGSFCFCSTAEIWKAHSFFHSIFKILLFQACMFSEVWDMSWLNPDVLSQENEGSPAFKGRWAGLCCCFGNWKNKCWCSAHLCWWKSDFWQEQLGKMHKFEHENANVHGLALSQLAGCSRIDEVRCCGHGAASEDNEAPLCQQIFSWEIVCCCLLLPVLAAATAAPVVRGP